MTTAHTAIYPNRNEEEDFRRATREAELILFPRHEIDEVFRLYRVPESRFLEIFLFLLINPDVYRVLIEAVPFLERVFGDARRDLEIDHDAVGGFEELFCVVQVEKEPEQALALLRQFDDIWFPRTTNDIRSYLNFTVDTEDDEPI